MNKYVMQHKISNREKIKQSLIQNNKEFPYFCKQNKREVLL